MTFATLIASILLLLISTLSWSETRYITDEFKITLRTGPSTNNSIVSMLKSGEAIHVIEQDNNTKYSLIKTSNGKQGYVLTRYLKKQPSGQTLYTQLKTQSRQQLNTIKTLSENLAALKQENNTLKQQQETLKQQLGQTTETLNQLKTSTRDTQKIIAQNNDQKKLIQTLQQEKSNLLAENSQYKDSTAMDWFIRGSGVSLLAFLIGILVTRIKWQKRDSWNDF